MSSHHCLNPPSGEVMHIKHLSENIGALYLSDDYSDITLIVSGQRFNSHKVILAARSQYFRALLFGGMKESVQQEIELSDTALPAFKELLKYIYTGNLSLTNQREEIILDILGMAHQYGFIDLEMAIADYLKEILNIKNICLIFDATRLYQLTKLTKVCYEYMDKHAIEVINHESFLQLSPTALNELVSRDSFYAPEIDIFRAVQSWVKANSDVDPNLVLKQVRFRLIDIYELLNVVRPTGLVSPDDILDAIAARTQTRNSELIYRGRLLVDENVAHPRYGAQVLQGEMRSFLLDGDTHNYDMDRGYTRHVITDLQDHGILIKLGTQSIINHIKMLLWDKDPRSYSYYIEVSIDQIDWVRIVDHSDYFCRSWQYLFFEPRVALYIRIVGTNNTVNKVFHIVSFEAYYTNHNERMSKGFLYPTYNVATVDRSACVTEGVSRSRNALLNGETSNYDWDHGYTCHQLGSGTILVQLGQPYIIDSMRLLLWDCDNRSYSYYIEVSGKELSWIRVVDKTNESCCSWQTLKFDPLPVVFIRIVGTHNTANEVFHCVHFECPAKSESLSIISSNGANNDSNNCNETKFSDHQSKRQSSSTLTPISLPIPPSETPTDTVNTYHEEGDSTGDSTVSAGLS